MNKLAKISLLILIIITLISTASYCSAPYDTETAHIIHVRKTIGGSGYILRNETTVKSPSAGYFEPSVKSGDRVAKGSPIGIFTRGNLDENLSAKLAETTRRINEIKESDGISALYTSDEARIFSVMKSTTISIRQNCRQQNYLAAAEDTRQLSMLVEKKNTVENSSAQDKLLIDLEAEKYSLEQKLGGIRESVDAPASGYYYSDIDGLEGAYTDSDMSLVTNETIQGYRETLSENKTKASTGKVVDSYVWYLAATIPRFDAEMLKPGKAVTVSVDGSGFVKATVLALNEDEKTDAQEDYVAVVLKSNRDIPGICEKRVSEFEICLDEHTGLYVPSAAIRVVDDITGVYVMNSGNNVEFRCVKILLEEDNYYIVSKNYTPPEGCIYTPLANYDNVLVNPEVKKLDRKSEKKH